MTSTVTEAAESAPQHTSHQVSQQEIPQQQGEQQPVRHEQPTERQPQRYTERPHTEAQHSDYTDDYPWNPPAHNINYGQVGRFCGYTADSDIITAGENTSCEFAASIFDAAMGASYVPTVGVEGSEGEFGSKIIAYSRVTEQNYNLECWITPYDGLLSCLMPNDPSVSAHFEPTGENPGFLPRVNTG